MGGASGGGNVIVGGSNELSHGRNAAGYGLSSSEAFAAETSASFEAGSSKVAAKEVKHVMHQLMDTGESSQFKAGKPTMWPVALDWDRRFNFRDKPESLDKFSLAGEAGIADTGYLSDLVQSSNAGFGQLAGLAMQWEASHNNAVRLLMEELDTLDVQRKEADSKRRRILNENVFYKMEADARKSIIHEEEACKTPKKLCSHMRPKPKLFLDDSQVSVQYWKENAEKLNQLLAESLKREEVLQQKLQEIPRLGTTQMPYHDLQNQLERVDNFLHFVLRNAPVVASHQDKELRYRFVYNNYPGFQAADIIGKTDMDVLKGKNLHETVEFKKEVIRRGRPAKREFSYENEDIGSMAFLLSAEPVFSKSGEVIGLNVVSMDITQEVATRENLIRIREEAAVQRATESELHKTMRITEETMKSKQLLATMSHEIRSPLSGVVSIAEILAATNLDPEQKQLVDIMLGSGDLVLQLINDILDLSKVESGAMTLEAKKFRPREIVKNVLEMGAASIQKSLTLEGSVSDEVPVEVIGDVLRVRQVLTNLVSNAIKFTCEGTVRISLKVHSAKRSTMQSSDELSSDNGSTQKLPQLIDNGDTIWLECEVSDTGIGIPEKALPFLFTKYMQVSETHARKYGGTGLGLAICKQLVELMGGRLKVTSKENQGSTFSFTLPYKLLSSSTESCTQQEYNGTGYFRFSPTARVQQDRVPSPKNDHDALVQNCFPSTQSLESRFKTAKISPSVACTENDKSQPKVLLAEDNKVNIMVAQSMLKRLGLEAKVVGNGAEALQAVKEEHYDMILMDVCMPVMDGLEATRLIREYQEHVEPENLHRRRSPIIAMTANALPENVAECYTHGMDSFIAKPVTFGKLQQLMHQFLPQLSPNG